MSRYGKRYTPDILLREAIGGLIMAYVAMGNKVIIPIVVGGLFVVEGWYIGVLDD